MQITLGIVLYGNMNHFRSVRRGSERDSAYRLHTTYPGEVLYVHSACSAGGRPSSFSIPGLVTRSPSNEEQFRLAAGAGLHAIRVCQFTGRAVSYLIFHRETRRCLTGSYKLY